MSMPTSANAVLQEWANAWVSVTSAPPASAQVSSSKFDNVAPPVPGRVMVASPVTLVVGV